MVAQPYSVDFSKPIVFQVGHLGEAYQEWVHQPIISKEGPRFFKNDFMELLTLTPWWVIPIVWLPVVCWFASKSLEMGLSFPALATTLVGGIFLWSFLEYLLHRFLFHMDTKGYWGNTIHYLFHGCHHKHPMDHLRLVFPPAPATLIAMLIWSVIKTLSAPSVAPALFAGVVSGYVMYDCTHYFLHHGKPDKGVVHRLKRYHMNHHYKLQTKGFGITSAFWDKVFRTFPA